MRLQPNDRVLMLAIPAERELLSTAGQLTNGSLIALGTREEVHAARARFFNLENVMFVEGRPDAIPWREAFFTKIVLPAGQQALIRSCGTELQRVMAPGGEFVSDSVDA